MKSRDLEFMLGVSLLLISATFLNIGTLQYTKMPAIVTTALTLLAGLVGIITAIIVFYDAASS